jgi:hypothetical protein
MTMRAHFSSHMPEPIVIETGMSGGTYYLSLDAAEDFHCELHEAMAEAVRAAKNKEVQYRAILAGIRDDYSPSNLECAKAAKWALDNLPELQ